MICIILNLLPSPKPLNAKLLFEEEVIEESVYLEEEVFASGEVGREDDLHRVVHAARAGGETTVDALGKEDAARLRVGIWCRVLDEDTTICYYFYLCFALDRDELHRVLERELNDCLFHFFLDVDFASGNIQILVHFTREYPLEMLQLKMNKTVCLSTMQR